MDVAAGLEPPDAMPGDVLGVDPKFEWIFYGKGLRVLNTTFLKSHSGKVRARRDHLNEFVFEILGRTTGADAHQTAGRRSVRASVDGSLGYPDGRVGAVAIALLGEEREFDLTAQLAQIGGKLAVPGMWKWVITLSDLSELSRVQAIYTKVILTCERHNATDPKKLPLHLVLEDADLDWAVFSSGSSFRGMRLTQHVQDEAGIVDLALSPAAGANKDDEIMPYLNHALRAHHVMKRIGKLTKINADERHLFLNVTSTGLSEGAFYHLTKQPRDVSKPAIVGNPNLPPTVTHLWLYAGWGRRVTRWTQGVGWDSPS